MPFWRSKPGSKHEEYGGRNLRCAAHVKRTRAGAARITANQTISCKGEATGRSNGKESMQSNTLPPLANAKGTIVGSGQNRSPVILNTGGSNARPRKREVISSVRKLFLAVPHPVITQDAHSRNDENDNA
jgi:hypothetical protein